MTFMLVVLWSGWMFATLQQYGADAELIGAGVLVFAAAMLGIQNQRLDYISIGQNGRWLEAGMQDRARPKDTDDDESE